MDVPNQTLSNYDKSESIDAAQEVVVKRILIQELVKNGNNGKEGDLWYLISADYLDKFLTLPVDSFEQLKQELGPFDCNSIVDANGNLYPENEEPVGTYNLSPAIFEYLSSWFGIVGTPVTRCLIVNPETGAKEIERYPPVFHIHQIGKKSPSGSSNSHRNHLPAPVISVSRTNTFQDLFDKIRVNVLKSPKNPHNEFRVWFIDSKNISEYHQFIPISTFIYDIPNKRLVQPDLLGLQLKSQGVEASTFHLLIDALESSTGKRSKSPKSYHIDSYLGQIDFSQYDFDAITSKGGNFGLNNLGNTCYMNSALQCLLHIPEINYYFYYNLYKRELNFDNPLGNKGDVANSFGSLLKLVFETPKSTSSSSVAPREFKSTIGRYSSMFSGYLQQDSQEFLSWLLDALHEDLNRIHKKPYCEKPELSDEEMNDPSALVKLAETCWNQHKLRNDSVITDLFTGMYQSTLVCPVCSKTSITFDPFSDMTLPLPVSKMWYHTFSIFDLSENGDIQNGPRTTGDRIMCLEVELNKRSNYDDLLNYLSKFLGVSKRYFFLYEIHQNTFFSDFQMDYNKNKFLPIGDIIRDTDDIVVYYIPHDPETDTIVPVLSSFEDPDKSYQVNELFGLPYFVVLNKETEVSSYETISSKLNTQSQYLSKLTFDETESQPQENIESKGPNEVSYSQEETVAEGSNLDPDTAVISENIEEGVVQGKENELELHDKPITGFSNDRFTIKYKNNENKRSNEGYRSRFNFGRFSSSKTERTIHVPLFKPNFHDFRPLVPEFEQKSIDKTQGLVDGVNPELEGDLPDNMSEDLSSEGTARTNETDGFVMINHDEDKAHDASSIEANSVDILESQASSSDEDTESEPQGANILSENDPDKIPSPPHPSFSDSIKPTTDNSPVGSSPSETSLTKNEENPILVTKDTIILCHWSSHYYQKYFEPEEARAWSNISKISNPGLEQNKAIFERQRNSKISLYDCLKSFSTPEVLGDQDLWYCPRCKDHRQATKTIQLWSTGDILTIHLKRFHSARAFSDKIDMVVDFPINGLSMKDYVANPNSGDEIYDLIAVDNHYGGLGGGHYTASAKNFRDGKWYYFNDSSVSELANPNEIITGAAYLLFYRKRSTSDLLGGPNLNSMLKNGREMYKKSLTNRKSHLEQVLTQTQAFNEAIQAKAKEDGNLEEPNEDVKSDNDTKKSRSFENIKKAQFQVENDENDLDYDSDDLDNIRKQRLISKEKNNSKLIQIKNGKQEAPSSPGPVDSSYESEST